MLTLNPDLETTNQRISTSGYTYNTFVPLLLAFLPTRRALALLDNVRYIHSVCVCVCVTYTACVCVYTCVCVCYMCGPCCFTYSMCVCVCVCVLHVWNLLLYIQYGICKGVHNKIWISSSKWPVMGCVFSGSFTCYRQCTNLHLE